MAAQPDGGPPVETGADGDHDVDLRELQAQVRRNQERIDKLITIVAHNTGRTAAQLEQMLD